MGQETLNPGEGYRLLEDERILKGDEMMEPIRKPGVWMPVFSHAIGLQSSTIFRVFRRQLPQSPSAKEAPR